MRVLDGENVSSVLPIQLKPKGGSANQRLYPHHRLKEPIGRTPLLHAATHAYMQCGEPHALVSLSKEFEMYVSAGTFNNAHLHDT